MKFLYFFVLYTSLTCCNVNKQHSLSYLEIEEEYEKEKRIEEEAYEKRLKINRIKMKFFVKQGLPTHSKKVVKRQSAIKQQ